MKLNEVAELVHAATKDDELKAGRRSLTLFTAQVYQASGLQLLVLANEASDNKPDAEQQPLKDEIEEAIAVSLLLRIANQLVSAASDLFEDGRAYAASALLRQLVEVEYLAWAFDEDSSEAKKWLHSTKKERLTFFTPAKLRKAAQGRFRSKDYGYHCELGGHPVPGAYALLNDDGTQSQLLSSDMLGHTGRIWDHIVGWAKKSVFGAPVLGYNAKMVSHYSRWKKEDPLTTLPPPP